jgi:putative Mg2+ transporter-C (MgtC) family protein
MNPGDVLLRLAIAVVLGAIVGIERQWHHKNAGVKTHALVAVGSAAFALISQINLGTAAAPIQIAAGVVTGIGFIGGGVIMRRGGSVQGINSAATLWATGSLGLAVGGGHAAIACGVLGTVLIAEVPLRWLSLWIDRHSSPLAATPTHHVVVAFDISADAGVRSALDAFASTCGASIVYHGESRSGGAVVLDCEVSLSRERDAEIRTLGERLASISGVSRVEWSRRMGDERES